MITKELFKKFISNYNTFDKGIRRIDEAISGPHNYCALFEVDWCDAVSRMLDCFLESHFTDDGQDLINAYLFEDCREFWINKDKTLFEDEKEEHYEFNSFEELYDVMLKFKNDYFLNV